MGTVFESLPAAIPPPPPSPPVSLLSTYLSPIWSSVDVLAPHHCSDWEHMVSISRSLMAHLKISQDHIEVCSTRIPTQQNSLVFLLCGISAVANLGNLEVVECLDTVSSPSKDVMWSKTFSILMLRWSRNEAKEIYCWSWTYCSTYSETGEGFAQAMEENMKSSNGTTMYILKISYSTAQVLNLWPRGHYQTVNIVTLGQWLDTN